MTVSRTWSRIGAAVGAVALSTTVAATPATAFQVPTEPTDLAAVGAALPDTVGTSTVIEVGITNYGPTDLPDLQAGEGSDARPRHVYITFPSGVTIEEILPPAENIRPIAGCYPMDAEGNPDWARRNQVDGHAYLCMVSEVPLPAGNSWLFPFRVTVTDSSTPAGSVTVFEGPNDPDLSNNTAAITVGEGSGDNGDDNTGDDGDSGDDNTGGSGDAGAGDTADDASDGEGGSLPMTGSTAALITVAGLVVLAGGAGLYLFSRKRRVTFSSDA